ncbi:hypothetical protein AAFC00_002471 [Neodothiora populina]|uniref:non-specific serine/threonine protein kinase n=1 Tax=Neodothiora populina TaxID=2781224 RepID=A0ABR3P777_9PEZI
MASSSRSSRNPPGPQVPDMQIGDFVRQQVIGKGSFASVYIASHRKKRSYAAIKSIHTSKLTTRLKQNLDSEIRILKQLQHPHIVALFACVETPGNIHIVMEYCQLSDLAAFMKSRNAAAQMHETRKIFEKYPNPPNGGLNEVLARHFIKQTASGMKYLREKNIVHRDLKPQNLLLNPPPTYMQRQRPEDVPLAVSEHSLVPAAGISSLPMIKIADFGFARHLPAASLAETLCGSPLYMAPEILNYQKYDAKADLWSVGTISYEMVVGKPPFRASNHIELLKRIKAAQDLIQFPAGLAVSREYKTFIRTMLKQDPIERTSFERFFQDPVIVGDIPGLVGEDIPQPPNQSMDLAMSQLTDRLRKQAITSSAQDREESANAAPQKAAPSPAVQPTPETTRKRSMEGIARKSSVSRSPRNLEPEPARPSSQTDSRRPVMSHHPTTPAPYKTRQGMEAAPQPYQRVSRFAAPGTSAPAKSNVTAQIQQERALRRANPRNSAEDDIAFEREWVKVDKQATEVNALADELENRFQRNTHEHAGLVRRATTQGAPTSATGAQPAAPSNAVQIASGRRADPTIHDRKPSFERRYAPNPSYATSALQKVLNAANARLFGSLGTSPPFALHFGKGPSPPQGYGAFPQYPAPLPVLLTDGRESPGPVDEDSKMCRAVEQAATRSDVVYGFAEVKYRQLLPATPSAEDGFSIRPISNLEHPLDADGEAQEEELTQVAIAAVAEEAFVLYVKALSILLRTINLVRYWWERHRPADNLQAGTSLPTNIRTVDASKRMNNVVQWARNRFNECLEKSEVVGRRLIEAQKQLPPTHPGHPSKHKPTENSASGNNFDLPVEQIHLTTGVTAERLMYERALEMSKAAAISELVGGGNSKEEMHSCELSYVTAVCLHEAVLENDDELSFKLPSECKSRSDDETINGLGDEDRATVVYMVNNTRKRLDGLRKKIAAFNAQQNAAKRLSATSLSNKGLSRTSSTSSPAPTVAGVGTDTPPK